MLYNFSDEAELRARRGLGGTGDGHRAHGSASLTSSARPSMRRAPSRSDATRWAAFASSPMERQKIEDRLSTSERADAWIVRTWSELLLGDLAAGRRLGRAGPRGPRDRARPSSFVLGATCWRVVALHALGRWDEALADAARAERAWQDSELRAPWYAINGFLAAFTIARGRGDSVGADHWRELVQPDRRAVRRRDPDSAPARLRQRRPRRARPRRGRRIPRSSRAVSTTCYLTRRPPRRSAAPGRDGRARRPHRLRRGPRAPARRSARRAGCAVSRARNAR